MDKIKKRLPEFRESDSHDDFEPQDEASYYLGDHFQMGGVDFGPDKESFFDKVINEKDYVGIGPKGYRRSDDRLYHDVCAALTEDPYLDASDIEVIVKEGIVYLRGMVRTRKDKREAESCIDHVHGVVDVMNELRLES